jgi:hypothetical protein
MVTLLWIHAWNPGINVSLPLVFTRHFCLYNHIGHILHRNCLLKHVIEGKIDGRMEVKGRRGRRCKQLLDDLKGSRGCWKLKRDARNSLWKSLGTCRKTTEWIQRLVCSPVVGRIVVRFPATGQETFLFCEAPRLMLGSTHAPAEKILGLSPGVQLWVL